MHSMIQEVFDTVDNISLEESPVNWKKVDKVTPEEIADMRLEVQQGMDAAIAMFELIKAGESVLPYNVQEQLCEDLLEDIGQSRWILRNIDKILALKSVLN